MNKTRLFIVILLLAAILGAAWYFFFRIAPAGPDAEVENTDPNLFPFTTGNGGFPVNTDDMTPEQIQEIIELDDSGENEKRLIKIWAEPQAGAVFLSQIASTTALRFVDSATGHIYDAIRGNNPEKISNVTIPEIKEALWGRDGKSLVLRYLKDDSTIQSFAATVSTSSISTAINGTFLPANIRAIGVSGDKTLYANPGKTSGALYLADINGGKKTEIFNSAFTDWSISFKNQKNAFIYTRPSGLVIGSGFILDLARSTVTKVQAEAYGLEGVISPSGNHVFLSYTDGSNIKSSVYAIAGNKYLEISPGTLASKCAWSQAESTTIYCAIPKDVNSGTYPDDWYKGLMNFNDTIWKIDVATGEMKLILDPVLEGQVFDVSDIVVGPGDSGLAITNKKDLSLWLYVLED